jgi:phage shock protein PspC (stress-responsive transcriptional regulator)
MKKVVEASVGGRSFSFEEDAYNRLSEYFVHFKSRLSKESADEVMSDVEERIAELFEQSTGGAAYRVVDLAMVRKAIDQLGMPDGSSEFSTGTSYGPFENSEQSHPDFTYYGKEGEVKRKLFRDREHGMISGVCAGLGAFLNVDTTVIRVLALIVTCLWGSGLLAYIVFMVVVPAAKTPYEKCLMYGLRPNAENMAKFSSPTSDNSSRNKRKDK